ncbi:glycosyltransferase family 76 protein [Leucogyrophana mollusca]|uniref:Glycosyltransferase family 76 protein n=1 Tax=Leucogyrophana mollusca TaxID=85980 RepID=A0ACB8BFA3_9AGAM|nr:glycosyltransferase family 76 protein [Leucogyrophana mollusca]
MPLRLWASKEPDNVRLLIVLTILSRVWTWTLISFSAWLLPLFDTSPKLVFGESVPPWTSALLRWDAFHFSHVAEKGYVYEHEWAFFMGTPFMMRASAKLLSLFGERYPATHWATLLQGGALTAVLCDSTQVLYHLSLHHLNSPSLAFLSSALSLMPSSPVALKFASYSEPYFTYLSYRGMLACTRSRWLMASICFTFAGMFRSNGLTLCGFIVWGMLIEPFMDGRKHLLTPARMIYTVVLVALPLVPFIQHNYTAYLTFCSSFERPEWCSQGMLPSIYSHVQSKYWNVGLLRYWTLQNLPNFAISLPVLLNVFTFCASYLGNVPGALFEISWRRCTQERIPHKSPFLSPTLLPHTIHALALTFILTLAAHTQIALRTLPSLPLTYWAAARLLVEYPRWGKVWVTWSVVWGAISCVLWAVFLPPA